MALIRINPTKMLVGGDKNKAKAFLGPGRSQMEILKKQMSFQNLTQGVRRIWLNEDTYVECIKCYNYQECRVWVKPAMAEELEEKVVYFYCRIVQSGSAPDDIDRAKFLNKTRDDRSKAFDRLILWESRKEIKTQAYKVYPDGQYGKYEDDSGWRISKPGKVVLDVDVKNRIVYTESGGIDVQTNKNEAALLNMADKYIEHIDANEQAVIPDPIDIASQSMHYGPIYSPLAIADACGLYPNYLPNPNFEAYFSDPIPQHWASPTGDLKDWYHVIYKGFELIELDPPVKNACWVTPESFYFSLQWPKLDENKEKYLPTQRHMEDIVLNPGGDPSQNSDYYLVCDGPEYSLTLKTYLYGTIENIPHYILAAPFHEGSYLHKSCNLNSDITEIEHTTGNYYTSNGLYPCFFVTLAGRTTEVRGLRYGGLYGEPPWDVGTNRWWTVGIGTELGRSYENTSLPPISKTYLNWLEFTIDEGEGFLSTPLEQTVYSIEYTKYPTDDPPPEWIKQLLDFTGGATGTFKAHGKQMLEWAVNEYPSLSDEISFQLINPLISSYNPPYDPSEVLHYHKVDLQFIVADKTSDFASTFSFVQINGNYYAALCAFRETNIYSGATKKQYTDPVEDTWGSKWFSIGVVFYLMFPSFSLEVENGTTTYWDIHSERESEQTIINHNRETELENYINTILQSIKEYPSNRELDGMYSILKNNWYDMTTGFVAQLD